MKKGLIKQIIVKITGPDVPARRVTVFQDLSRLIAARFPDAATKEEIKLAVEKDSVQRLLSEACSRDGLFGLLTQRMEWEDR